MFKDFLSFRIPYPFHNFVVALDQLPQMQLQSWKKINNQTQNARRKQTLNLNEKCNEWLKKEMVNYVDGNPQNMDTILFDFNQFKKDTICMVDTLACQLQCKAHLQKTADVLCLSRTTIHRIIKEKWFFGWLSHFETVI